jgi:acyl-CoA synthetase (NDP forming)
VSPKVNAEIFRILLSNDAIDGLISIIVGSKPREYAQEVVNAHLNVARQHGKPVMVSWTADKAAEDLMLSLEENDVPVYETPERAVKCLAALAKYSEFLKKNEGKE